MIIEVSISSKSKPPEDVGDEDGEANHELNAPYPTAPIKAPKTPPVIGLPKKPPTAAPTLPPAFPPI